MRMFRASPQLEAAILHPNRVVNHRRRDACYVEEPYQLYVSLWCHYGDKSEIRLCGYITPKVANCIGVYININYVTL